MASLTPLSKGLIALTVVGAMVSAVWNFALKERLGEKSSDPAPVVSQPATPQTPSAPSLPSTPSRPAAPPAPQALPQAAVKPAEAAPAGGVPSPQPIQAPAPRLSPAEHAETGRRLLQSKEYEQARSHLEQAVQGGDGAAACLLGEMTLQGQGGIAPNQDEAAKLFQLAQSRNTICFASGR